MESTGVIIGLVIAVATAALICIPVAWFAQLAMRWVVRQVPLFGKAYVIVFKVMMIILALNFLLSSLVQLAPVCFYVSSVVGIVIWLGLNSYLYGLWFTRRHKPIGFTKGLLVNLIVSAMTFVLVTILSTPLYFIYVRFAAAE